MKQQAGKLDKQLTKIAPGSVADLAQVWPRSVPDLLQSSGFRVQGSGFRVPCYLGMRGVGHNQREREEHLNGKEHKDHFQPACFFFLHDCKTNTTELFHLVSFLFLLHLFRTLINNVS